MVVLLGLSSKYYTRVHDDIIVFSRWPGREKTMMSSCALVLHDSIEHSFHLLTSFSIFLSLSLSLAPPLPLMLFLAHLSSSFLLPPSSLLFPSPPFFPSPHPSPPPNTLKDVYHITPTDGKVVGVYKRL